MSDLDKINSIFNAKIDSVKNKEDLQNIKTEFFGKNGQITQQFKTLGSLDPEKRKEFASNLNRIKDDLTIQIEQKNLEIENLEINDEASITVIADISGSMSGSSIHELKSTLSKFIKNLPSNFLLIIVAFNDDYFTLFINGSRFIYWRYDIGCINSNI